MVVLLLLVNYRRTSGGVPDILPVVVDVVVSISHTPHCLQAYERDTTGAVSCTRPNLSATMSRLVFANLRRPHGFALVHPLGSALYGTRSRQSIRTPGAKSEVASYNLDQLLDTVGHIENAGLCGSSWHRSLYNKVYTPRVFSTAHEGRVQLKLVWDERFLDGNGPSICSRLVNYRTFSSTTAY